jgi:hypothetical protein
MAYTWYSMYGNQILAHTSAYFESLLWSICVFLAFEFRPKRPLFFVLLYRFPKIQFLLTVFKQKDYSRPPYINNQVVVKNIKIHVVAFYW